MKLIVVLGTVLSFGGATIVLKDVINYWWHVTSGMPAEYFSVSGVGVSSIMIGLIVVLGALSLKASRGADIETKKYNKNRKRVVLYEHGKE